jgi:hypothetical protein
MHTHTGAFHFQCVCLPNTRRMCAFFVIGSCTLGAVTLRGAAFCFRYRNRSGFGKRLRAPSEFTSTNERSTDSTAAMRSALRRRLSRFTGNGLITSKRITREARKLTVRKKRQRQQTQSIKRYFFD